MGGLVRLASLLLTLVVTSAGCAGSTTRWAEPARSPAMKPDMSTAAADSYACVRESRQEIGFGERASSK